MPKGDEEEIAGRGDGFFRFVALLAPRALLERPTLNPSLIRDQFRLIASVFSIKPILIWRLRAYAIYVANARDGAWGRRCLDRAPPDQQIAVFAIGTVGTLRFALRAIRMLRRLWLLWKHGGSPSSVTARCR